jgi:hypothetical protein
MRFEDFCIKFLTSAHHNLCILNIRCLSWNSGVNLRQNIIVALEEEQQPSVLLHHVYPP